MNDYYYLEVLLKALVHIFMCFEILNLTGPSFDLFSLLIINITIPLQYVLSTILELHALLSFISTTELFCWVTFTDSCLVCIFVLR